MLFRMSFHVRWKYMSSIAGAVDAVKVTVGVFSGYIHKRPERSKKEGFGINLSALSVRSVKKYSSGDTKISGKGLIIKH